MKIAKRRPPLRSLVGFVGVATKLILLVLLFQIAWVSSVSATWKQIAQFPARVMCGYFFDRNNGFVCVGGTTATAAIMHTTNGGQSWTTCSIPAWASQNQVWFDDIWMRNRTEGWATVLYGTSGSNLWHTTDGGLTWVNTGFGGNPVGVRQTSKALIVSQWAGSGFSVSLDDGNSFPITSGFSINGLSFVDDLHGAASGFYNQFYYTADGGLNWTPAKTGFVTEAWGIYGEPGTGNFIAAPENAYSVTTSVVYGSTNYGVDWTAVDTLPFKTSGDVEGVGFAMYVQNSGSAGGVTGLYRTTDLGRSWANIGGPNSGRWDTRFVVTECGNVIYAFDSVGSVWKTTDAGDGAIETACEIPLVERLNTIASSLCDSLKQVEFLHNVFPDTIAVVEVRFADTAFKAVRSRALHFDSIPPLVHFVLPGDSLGFAMGWEPSKFRTSQGGDSTLVRIIYYLPRIGRRDTVYVPVSLLTLASKLAIGMDVKALHLDSVLTCTAFDTTISITNNGCDSFSITRAYLAQSTTFTLLDSNGKQLFLPTALPIGGARKFRIRFSPIKVGVSYDTLRLLVHQPTHDSTLLLPLSGTATHADPMALQTEVHFDAVPTCAAIDSLWELANHGCDTIFITQLDLKSLDWTLFDQNGGPLSLPIAVPPSRSGRFKLHFAPHTIGLLGTSITIHFQYEGFDSVHIVQITGAGRPVGALAFNRALIFGKISVCSSIDSTIEFMNSTCEKLLVDSLLVPSPFVFLDSSLLPFWLDPGKKLHLRLRYHPSKRATESGNALLKSLVNSVIHYDTLQFVGVGVPGASSLSTSMALNSFRFSTRSECGATDSINFVCRNFGCDSLVIESAHLEGNLAPIDLTVSVLLPKPLINTDSLRVSLRLARLVSGAYTGNLHLKLRSADGSIVDSLIPISSLITKGTKLLALDTSKIDVGNFKACSRVDTLVIYSNQGCLPITVASRSFAGKGFALVTNHSDPFQLLPGESDTVRFVYDGTSSGVLGGTLTISTNADEAPLRTIGLSGSVRPIDSVNFFVRVPTTAINAGDPFEVAVYPDRQISGKGLKTIHATLAYRGDGANFISPSTSTSLNIVTDPIARVGTTEYVPFLLTSSGDIALDPSVAIARFQFRSTVSDSNQLPFGIGDLLLNGSDPTFSKCVLQSNGYSAATSMKLLCGDSTIEIALRRGAILRASRIHPDPATGAMTVIDLVSKVNGVAVVELHDLLGRTVRTQRLELHGGVSMRCELDLRELPTGGYFYTMNIETTELGIRSNALRGSLYVLH